MNHLYEDIAKRTNGEIYLGVVGPVRSGKSTFIKKFLEEVILPNVSGYDKERTVDATPQSASGKTVMTTEPKFIPDEAVSVSLDNVNLNVRLIDCVGYMVKGALGSDENGQTRLVHTPWQEESIPFDEAGEIGTRKVINDHATLGIMVTTDGTIGEIPRESYKETEKRVIEELKRSGKPFVIVLNSATPHKKEAQEIALHLEETYQVPVALVNATELNLQDFEGIFKLLLSEFPVREISYQLPKYVLSLENDHYLKESLLQSIKSSSLPLQKMGDCEGIINTFSQNQYVENAPTLSYDLGNGTVTVSVSLKPTLYYDILSELCGFPVENEEDLFTQMKNLSEMKKEYDKFVSAIDEVNETGYGIVLPSVDEMSLDEPEVCRHGGSYGIRLKAHAPSIHFIKADIETEVRPMVGSQAQAEEIVKNLSQEYEEEPSKLWETNMFGKSVFDMVSDGFSSKLQHIGADSKAKLSDTLSRAINEESNGIICILL